MIGTNALFCWTAADLLTGKVDFSNSNFQKNLRQFNW